MAKRLLSGRVCFDFLAGFSLRPKAMCFVAALSRRLSRGARAAIVQ